MSLVSDMGHRFQTAGTWTGNQSVPCLCSINPNCLLTARLSKTAVSCITAIQSGRDHDTMTGVRAIPGQRMPPTQPNPIGSASTSPRARRYTFAYGKIGFRRRRVAHQHLQVTLSMTGPAKSSTSESTVIQQVDTWSTASLGNLTLDTASRLGKAGSSTGMSISMLW